MTAPAAAATSGPIAPAVPRPAPQAAADPFAFGAVLDSLPGASAKADASTTEEGQRPSNESPQEESSRGQTARHSLLNDSALLAALPFALRAASMMGENPQAADNSPSSTSPCDERSEIRGQRRIPCRRREGVDRWATGRRTRFSLWPLHVRGRDREPHARGQRAVRAGRRFRRQPCGPTRSRRRKRRCFRLFAGRGHASESLGRRRSADCKRSVSDADRASRRARPQRIARALTRAAAQEAARIGQKPDVSGASAGRPGRDLRRSPRADGMERQGGRRSAPRPGYRRRSIGGANRPVRRAAFGALLRRGVVATRRLDGRRRTSRRHAPRERARRRLRAPRLRRSGRSTSIFRRAASRMSR